MDGLLEMLILVGFLVAGAMLPRIASRRFAPPVAIVEKLIKVALWTLLLVMGFRMGNDPSLSARLGELGLLAAVAAVLGVIGTIVGISLAFALAVLLRPGAGWEPAYRRSPEPSRRGRGPQRHGSRGYLRAPLTLLAIIVGGFIVGICSPPLHGAAIPLAAGWALNILLFFIGMQFTQSGLSLGRTFLKPATLMVPLATCIGTLAASLLLVPIFHLGPGRALALSAGFGWYSLSGVLISRLGDPALGSAAFLANMIREAIALLSIPFLARTRLPALAVGVGGATAMDVTLPLIEQSAGPAIVPLSFASGALLSLSVPLLVPFFFGIG